MQVIKRLLPSLEQPHLATEGRSHEILSGPIRLRPCASLSPTAPVHRSSKRLESSVHPLTAAQLEKGMESLRIVVHVRQNWPLRILQHPSVEYRKHSNLLPLLVKSLSHAAGDMIAVAHAAKIVRPGGLHLTHRFNIPFRKPLHLRRAGRPVANSRTSSLQFLQ